jgi:hypothetical protein
VNDTLDYDIEQWHFDCHKTHMLVLFSTYFNNKHNQIAPLVAKVIEIYLASIENNIVMFLRLLD